MERPLPLSGADPCHECTPRNCRTSTRRRKSPASPGVRPRDVLDLAASGLVQPLGGRFFSAADAVIAVQTLKGQRAPCSSGRCSGQGGGSAPRTRAAARDVRDAARRHRRRTRAADDARDGETPGAGHRRREERDAAGFPGHARVRAAAVAAAAVVEPAPPPPAERKGVAKMRSPVPVRRPPAAGRSAGDRQAGRTAASETGAGVVAPVVPVAADPQDRAGMPWIAKEPPPQETDESRPRRGRRHGHRPGYRHRRRERRRHRTGFGRRHGRRTVSARHRHHGARHHARSEAGLHRGRPPASPRRRRGARDRREGRRRPSATSSCCRGSAPASISARSMPCASGGFHRRSDTACRSMSSWKSRWSSSSVR